MKLLPLIITLSFVAGCSLPKDVRNVSVTPTHVADYVLTNGKVYTVNEKQPWAEAVAVRNTRDIHWNIA